MGRSMLIVALSLAITRLKSGRGSPVKFWYKNPLEGYRRCTYMMMDQDIVAVSPSSVYRVLSKAGLMKQWSKKESRKGSGFVQPLAVHEHWHIDILRFILKIKS